MAFTSYDTYCVCTCVCVCVFRRERARHRGYARERARARTRQKDGGRKIKSGEGREVSKNLQSLLQKSRIFLGLFCRRDMIIWRAYTSLPPHTAFVSSIQTHGYYPHGISHTALLQKSRRKRITKDSARKTTRKLIAKARDLCPYCLYES